MEVLHVYTLKVFLQALQTIPIITDRGINPLKYLIWKQRKEQLRMTL